MDLSTQHAFVLGADAGKSGLRIEGRESLQQLIQDVQDGTADFEVILVYDVSRWGRFQDADESAYYEYICRRANKQVEYCAEQLENDGGPVATIVKSVERAMAGEYSREPSNKVFIGQCHLIERGFRQGGAAGFGLRRVLLDERGDVKAYSPREAATNAAPVNATVATVSPTATSGLATTAAAGAPIVPAT